MTMYEHFLTVGLFDKDSLKQEIATDEAKKALANMLINDYGIYAFTMLDCNGVYKMASGEIVREPSIRIEIASDACIPHETIKHMIASIKQALNQESVMYKMQASEIDFI